MGITHIERTMKTIAFAVVLAAACVAALPGRVRRDSSALFYELPSNASLVLGGIQYGFDYADLPYGYYADELNACAIFHVCLPNIDHDVYVQRQFSFMCAAGTMFDQERLIPCSQSALFRTSNEYFGREQDFFLQK